MNESNETGYDYSAPEVQDRADVLDDIEEQANELNLVGFIKWGIGGGHNGHVRGAEDDIQAFFEELQETVPEIAVDFDDFHAEERERDHTYEEFTTLHTHPVETDSELSPEEREKFSMD